MESTHTDTSDFENYSEKIIGSSKNEEQLKQNILSAIESLGFSDFDYSILSKGNQFDFLLNSAPISLMQTYNHEKLYEHDLFLECAFQAKNPIYQSTVNDQLDNVPFQSERMDKNRAIRDLIFDHSYFDAFCVPIEIKSADKKILFSVMSKGEKKEKFRHKTVENRVKLVNLSRIIHETCINRLSKKLDRIYQNNKTNILTPRQIMVIDAYAKHAKTAQQVADQLHMSVSTVNHHLENIKTTLGAISLANAVYIAMKKGIIEFY